MCKKAFNIDAAIIRIKTSTQTLATEYTCGAVVSPAKQQTTGKTELSIEYIHDPNNGIF